MLEHLDVPQTHPVEDEPPQVGVHPSRPGAGEQATAADDGRRPADGAEEAPVLDGYLGATDDDDAARLGVEVLDQRGVVENSWKCLALDPRERGTRAGRQHQRVGIEGLPACTHSARVDHLSGCVDHELDAELLCALPVHVRVRATALRTEQLHQLQDRRRTRIELRVPEATLQRPRLIELPCGLTEEVVGYAGLVRARAAQEGPALQHQRPAAETAQDGGAEPACAPAADEDRVEVRAEGWVEVRDRPLQRSEVGVVDDRAPVRDRQACAVDVHPVPLCSVPGILADQRRRPGSRGLHPVESTLLPGLVPTGALLIRGGARRVRGYALDMVQLDVAGDARPADPRLRTGRVRHATASVTARRPDQFARCTRADPEPAWPRGGPDHCRGRARSCRTPQRVQYMPQIGPCLPVHRVGPEQRRQSLLGDGGGMMQQQRRPGSTTGNARSSTNAKVLAVGVTRFPAPNRTLDSSPSSARRVPIGRLLRVLQQCTVR